MNRTTITKPLTYTENGVTSGIVCAFCIEYRQGRQEAAVALVQTHKGRYPACADHA